MVWGDGNTGRYGGGRGGNDFSSSGRGRGAGRGGGNGGRENSGRGNSGRGTSGRGNSGNPPQNASRFAPPPAPPITSASTPSTPAWGAATAVQPPPPAPVQQLTQQFEQNAAILPPNQEEVKHSVSLARRQAGGKVGKPVTLLANHFRVKYNPPDDIYRYDVEFKEEGGRKLGNQDGGAPPKALAERLMRALLTQLGQQFPRSSIVSDFRKNVFSAARIPFQGTLNVTGIDIGERRGVNQEPVLFQAFIKPVEPEAFRMSQIEEFMSGRMNTTPHDAIQALDVVLRHLGAQRMTMVGRNFFSGHNANPIGGGAEVWSGYFQSLRPTQNGMIINLDVASTAFVRAMPALEFVAEVCATYNNTSTPQSLTKVQHTTVHKTVRGIKVEANHLPNRRSYRVNGLSPQSADQTFFEDENGRRVSIVQYFQQKYQRRLQYPKLPCLHVGAMDKKTYLPIEVCRVLAGTKVPRKLNEDQTANMIRFTATKPDIRRQNIDRHAQNANFESDATVRAFGMTVDPRMVQVTGRVLPAPSVVYGRNQLEQPRDGVWNMRNKQYFQPAQLVSCAIINTDFRLNTRAIETFFKALFNEATNLGMGKLATTPPIITQGRNDLIPDLYEQAIEAGAKAFKGTKPQIIFMINPRQNTESYGALKIASDLQYGIPSQCMLSKHVLKANGQYIGNILLKINTKLNGCNSILQPSAFPAKVQEQPTIIFGADVTHGTTSDNRPSIAALIGSLNKDFTSHSSVIHVQGPREEEMVNLAEMARKLLVQFFKKSRVKPRQIVFFRDGVSEGQFQMVLNKEVTALRAACASLENGYKPPITFVIVQKRHHTRFFGTKPNEVDRSGNIRAGTVVDTGVCHPVENDFYLTSHAGIQGTSRPTHYQVLMDEIGFSSDEIQKLTNNLTYTYARCTRSVSMVPSAYYSHLLAFRARFFMGDDFSDSASNASNSSVRVKTPDVHPALEHTMFYV